VTKLRCADPFSFRKSNVSLQFLVVSGVDRF
jgi:hypothetical protein